MTTRERLHLVVERIPEESLDAAIKMVEPLAPQDDPNEHILSYLMRIQMDGPADLSENFDLYASGEKRIDEDKGVS